MIIGFKQEFVETLRLLKQSKVTMKMSGSGNELSKKLKPWPVSAEPFFPLVTRCVIRQESFGYILAAYDIVFIVDDLTVSVLKMCDGFNTAGEIKRCLREKLVVSEPRDNESFESSVEQALSNLGKYGIVIWIPQSQVHVERRTE